MLLIFSQHEQVAKPKSNAQESLIVDFPHNRNLCVKRQVKKSVRFSSMSEVLTYEQPYDISTNELFHSKADYQVMKNDRVCAVNDARAMSAIHGVKSDEELSCNFSTGLENFIDLSIMSKVLRGRKERVTAVLREQGRQTSSDIVDQEALAYVSRLRSMWAVKRAEKIGAFQAKSNSFQVDTIKRRLDIGNDFTQYRPRAA